MKWLVGVTRLVAPGFLPCAADNFLCAVPRVSEAKQRSVRAHRATPAAARKGRHCIEPTARGSAARASASRLIVSPSGFHFQETCFVLGLLGVGCAELVLVDRMTDLRPFETA